MTPDPNPTEALLPCPFCGGTNIDPQFALDGEGNYSPGCMDCSAMCDTEEQWNRRARAPERDADAPTRHYDLELKFTKAEQKLAERDAELAAMRQFIGFVAKDYDCDTGANGVHSPHCRCCEAERLLSASTAGTELLERLRKQGVEILSLIGQLAAVTAERDRAKLETLDSDRAHDAMVSECERQADRITAAESARDALARRVEAMNDGLEAAKSILWMAENYAESGGSRGPEMRDYHEACDRIETASSLGALGDGEAKQ